MNNLKSKLLKALMGVSLGALGAFAVTFVVYFWNLDMKLTSVMEGILLKHYDKIDRDQHLCFQHFSVPVCHGRRALFAAVFACKQFMKSLDVLRECPYNA